MENIIIQDLGAILRMRDSVRTAKAPLSILKKNVSYVGLNDRKDKVRLEYVRKSRVETIEISLDDVTYPSKSHINDLEEYFSQLIGNICCPYSTDIEAVFVPTIADPSIATITINEYQEGTYYVETLTNITSVTYEVNTVAQTLPFSVEYGDTLEIEISPTDIDETAYVHLKGRHSDHILL